MLQTRTSLADGLDAVLATRAGMVLYKGMELNMDADASQRRRRARRCRKSLSDVIVVSSKPLSSTPSMSARIIAARVRAWPVFFRMTLTAPSSRTICRSNKTTDTLDHSSL
jgi:hypothetical protein